MRKCRTCRFAEPVGKGQRNGQGEEIDIAVCRKEPPVVGPLAQPLVALDLDWCGEFQPTPLWYRL
jgi:hypothetical protein